MTERVEKRTRTTTNKHHSNKTKHTNFRDARVCGGGKGEFTTLLYFYFVCFNYRYTKKTKLNYFRLIFYWIEPM